jgi:hypothetical protein
MDDNRTYQQGRLGMTAFPHIRDPQRESIFDDIEQMKALGESLNPTRSNLMQMFDAICRPVIHSTRNNAPRAEQYTAAQVMGDEP